PPDIKTWSHEAGYSQTNQIPYRSGDYYIFRERKKGTNRLTVSRARKLTGKRTIILDEKSECAANEHLVSFRLYGDLMAYGKSVNGSDTSTWRVRDLKTGKDQENIAIQVHNGRVGFLPGGSGLWYRKSPGPNSSQPGSNTLRSSTKRDHQQIGIYFTALQGKEAGKERLYYKPNHRKSIFISPYFILENLVLISECYRRDSYLVFLRRQNPKSRKTVQLFKDCPGRYTLVGEVDGKLLFQTDATNSRGAVLSVKVDKKRLRVGKPQVVTQVEDGNTFIDSAHVVAGGILVNYTDIERGTSKLSLFDIDGRKIKDLKLPVEGIISGIIANRKVLSYTIESIGSSPRIFSHNVKTNRSKQLFDSSFRFPKELDISLVRVKSLDGTEIPMRLVRLRDTAPKGAATIMHVYGGFGVSQLPVLNHQAISWILMGGVWAQPYLRGGSEFGAHWHNQAIGVKKQRTFDDAIACARWLITHGYCKRSKLAIMGGSNGGLTVGAAICQAPELFGAAACYNGLFDMLKYESYGIGWIYADEYGSVKKKNDFQALKKYSPYHCLKETDHFPSVLLTASDHDDRVNPCHSYKFAALLQSKMGHKANILLNVESNRGHTGAIPSNLALDELLFIADALKLRLDK
ncbi:MAG: prolyl oligopeptidase family serine peptidase, partial [Cyanobacteria bacterium]|nr:prolyl oligopeptidase family serine peptidase [Cyanobacteriota bacterium]